jgi:pyruvate dehydrogenase E2 component (dihydrolipoamide acetyltransferase)
LNTLRICRILRIVEPTQETGETRPIPTEKAEKMPSLTLPQPAADILSATVVRWRLEPGQPFAAGQVLVELEAEEALVHVEAAGPGVLAQIVAQPGQTVLVGAELARIEAAHLAPSSPAQASLAENNVPQQHPSSGGSKVAPILMPQAGNTMEEGIVVVWRVKEGDVIAVGQIICEIETDKATIEYESPEAGRLARIVARAGEPVPVKELIAVLADADADADAYLAGQGASAAPSVAAAADGNGLPGAAAAVATGAASQRAAVPTPVTAEGRVKASPAARRVAAERGVDLATVGAGSGPGGRILSTDVASVAVAAAAAGNGRTPAERRTPMSKMRRAIGLNLQQSKQSIPHFYMRMTIDADPLLAFYRAKKPQANCTLNDVIVLAVGRAMHEFPGVRSQIVGNEIVEYPHANIGVAVGVDEGLVVPVVLGVDTMSLAQLAAEARRVVESARKGMLENIGKGNFTISNLGMFGVEEFSAIINPPESGILAVSAIREAVIVAGGAMRPGHVMTMTLSADHRVVDGVLAAKFTARLQEILEHPAEELA